MKPALPNATAKFSIRCRVPQVRYATPMDAANAITAITAEMPMARSLSMLNSDM